MEKSTMARWLRCMVFGGWVLQACSDPSSSAATKPPAREAVVGSNGSSIAGTGAVALAPPGVGTSRDSSGRCGASFASKGSTRDCAMSSRSSSANGHSGGVSSTSRQQPQVPGRTDTVRYFDGRDDNWFSVPAETRYL